MKKAVLAVTALFAAATAAPAVAAEFSYGGYMRYRGIFIDPGTANGIWGGAASETNERWEYRVRQFFNLKVNDHVTTNVKFEWNSQFGDENAFNGGSGDLQFGQGASELQFRLKNAFVKFDLPGAPVSLTVGQQDFSTPKAIIAVEDGTGIKLNAKIDPIDVTVFWQRLTRGLVSATGTGGNNATTADDGDWYGIVPSFKAGGISIAPHISYVNIGPSAVAIPDTEVWFLGVDANGKLGPAGFTFDFIYQTGDTLAGTVDISSFILDASASLAAGPGTLTLKVMYSPGDDNTGDSDLENWQQVLTTDLGWSPFFHDGSSNSGFAGSLTPAPGTGGLLGVGVEFALSPYKDFTLTPNAYYLMANEDVNLAGGANADDLYGIELGIQANWKIWDSVALLGQFDYLIAGDVFENAAGETDDAWRLIIGPSLSW